MTKSPMVSDADPFERLKKKMSWTDVQVKQALDFVGIVAVLGQSGSGKTTIAKEYCKSLSEVTSVRLFDDVKKDDPVLAEAVRLANRRNQVVLTAVEPAELPAALFVRTGHTAILFICCAMPYNVDVGSRLRDLGIDEQEVFSLRNFMFTATIV